METTNTNYWRLRINKEGNLVACQIRLKDGMTWEEYLEKYAMTEISDKDSLIQLMTNEFRKIGMNPIKETFNVYFASEVKGYMTEGIKEVLDTFPGAKFIQCKDCKKFFLITDEDTKWYTEHDLNVPKRCGDCRKRRKAEAKKTVTE